MTMLSDLIQQYAGSQPANMLNDVMGAMLASTINAPPGTPMSTGLGFAGMKEAQNVTPYPSLANDNVPLVTEEDIAKMPNHGRQSTNIEDQRGVAPFAGESYLQTGTNAVMDSFKNFGNGWNNILGKWSPGYAQREKDLDDMLNRSLIPIDDSRPLPGQIDRYKEGNDNKLPGEP